MSKKILKYIYAFIVSLLILILGVYLTSVITENKIEKVRSLETGIAINILSLETQFALLQEVSCEDLKNDILSEELQALARKLQHMESTLPADDEELIRLKKYYFLLEIKDYILKRKISQQCNKNLDFIFYFYSNGDDCKKCKEQGIILLKLLKEVPHLRVYNFDYNLSLSATETLKKLYSVRKPLPILVVNGKTFRGFTDEDTLRELLGIQKVKEK